MLLFYMLLFVECLLNMMLNRFLNSLDTSGKSEGIVILEETSQKDIDEGLREWVNECLDEQKEE